MSSLSLQDELYKIEEEKLSRPPDFIDLSLNYVRKPGASRQSSEKNVIQVAEFNSNKNEAAKNLRVGQLNKMNRVALQMQAANVGTFIHIFRDNKLDSNTIICMIFDYRCKERQQKSPQATITQILKDSSTFREVYLHLQRS